MIVVSIISEFTGIVAQSPNKRPTRRATTVCPFGWNDIYSNSSVIPDPCRLGRAFGDVSLGNRDNWLSLIIVAIKLQARVFPKLLF